MSVQVRLPAALRSFAGTAESVTLDGTTAGEVIERLLARHEGLKKHLLSEDGALRNFVNVYVNEDDVRSLGGLGASVKDGDTVLIVPAIAGGAPAAACAPPAGLGAEELRRYQRHIMLPEVGIEGQLRLKRASVLVVGAGGLGSPVALYLAAAGVGRIGLVDFDTVDASNLQRQVLYTTAEVGAKKLDAAKARLSALNPNVEVVAHETRLTSRNALELFARYDLIADGTDNFATRYLVNDACVLAGKPNVYASIFRFEGQVSVFAAPGGPCYRCLYPEPPPPGLVPSCAEGGVLGVLPGAVGTLQALEAVKLILGIGKPAIGRLVLFDALALEWRTLKARRNPACPVCGDAPTIRALGDYEAFCGVKPAAGAALRDISVEDLKAKIDRKERFILLDVREPHESALARIPGATLIPLGELPDRLGELDATQEIVAHCKMGGRSARAVVLLREKGFAAVNVAGGIDAWARRVDPAVSTY